MPRKIKREKQEAIENKPLPTQGKVITYQQDTGRRRTNRNGAVVFAITMFALGFLVVAAIFYFATHTFGLAALICSSVFGFLVANSIHVVFEWERAVVLRFGKFNRTAGPGVVFTWPIIEFYTVRIDQRTSSTFFGAEETLTSDLVPVSVDAVVFWMVYDAKRAAVEVEDYVSAVNWMAQTALREAIGQETVHELAMRREELDEKLKDELSDRLSDWGIDIIYVQVRDIIIPKELQEAMAAEAVAQRKRNARMILADTEKEIAEAMDDAAEVYGDKDAALKLRTMHLAYESVEKSGGTIMVPSSFAEGFVTEPKAQ